MLFINISLILFKYLILFNSIYIFDFFYVIILLIIDNYHQFKSLFFSLQLII